MATLTKPQKLFIVQRLACFDTPTEVAKAVKEEFGITVSLPALSVYDPNNARGKELSKELREAFEATRKRFLEDTSDIPIANKAYRLRVLQRVADRAEAKGNTPMVVQALEQAAKEVGDVFTNKQSVKHSGEIKNTQPVINLTMTQ